MYRRTASLSSGPRCLLRRAFSSPSATRPESAAFTGSVPAYNSHIVVHSSVPPSSWPARFDSTSLLGQLAARAKAWGGKVNLSHSPELPPLDIASAPFQPEPAGRESFPATLYLSNRPPIELDPLSLSQSLPESFDDLLAKRNPSASTQLGDTHIYVCTHGNRDCRCGETGGQVFRALKEAVKDRPDVRVREISHVGGHVWAANVLTYPSGDWYGLIKPPPDHHDIPRLLSTVIPLAPNPDRPQPAPLAWPEKWRGRMGIPPTTTQPPSTHQSEALTVPLTFELWDGQTVRLFAPLGENLMQVGKRAGFGSIEGVCGGNLECATCHMYLPSSTFGGAPPVEEASEDEEDELAYAIGRKEGVSRLGCQIRVTEALARWCASGSRIGIPRY